jgi:hypothetical protein
MESLRNRLKMVMGGASERPSERANRWMEADGISLDLVEDGKRGASERSSERANRWMEGKRRVESRKCRCRWKSERGLSTTQGKPPVVVVVVCTHSFSRHQSKCLSCLYHFLLCRSDRCTLVCTHSFIQPAPKQVSRLSESFSTLSFNRHYAVESGMVWGRKYVSF